MEMALSGHNFSLLGMPGTGKTFVVSKLIQELKGNGANVAVTASTGPGCLSL